MKSSKGFTLIELLVVIAIIGILSGVVLASLNNARAKGADAAVKANLANARAEAELFYDSQATPTYEGVCALTGTNVIGDSVSAAATASGATYTTADAVDGASNKAVCHDTAAGWAAVAPLKSGAAYCVDSTGAAASTTVTVLNGATTDITCN